MTPIALDPAKAAPRLHPWPVRIMHWINAVAIIIMIGSGWEIYNDEIIFGWIAFPKTTVLGIWAAGALQWHFFGMWLLTLNGIAYLAYGLVTGRFRRKLLPIRVREVIATVKEALSLHLAHDDITVYNGVQKLLYVGVIAIVVVQVLSGLAIWKPIQLQSLAALFYDFQGARLAHFLGMAAICGFLVIHVALALLAPKTLWAMISGGPRTPHQPARGDA